MANALALPAVPASVKKSRRLRISWNWPARHDIIAGMKSVVKIDSKVMHGTPCFSGTRVAVQTFFDWLEEGNSVNYFLEQFPSVKREQVLTLLESAREHALAEAVAMR